MKITARFGLLVLGAMLLAPAIAADDPMEKAIKARQGLMQLRSFNAGPLFGMAKGDIEYDAELATKLVRNLQLLVEVDMGRAWPKGSDSANYPGKTAALQKIWSTYPEIADYGKRYNEAVKGLAAVAGSGRDALKSEIGNLGKACKGCHDEFREKQ